MAIAVTVERAVRIKVVFILICVLGFYYANLFKNPNPYNFYVIHFLISSLFDPQKATKSGAA